MMHIYFHNVKFALEEAMKAKKELYSFFNLGAI